MEPNGDRSGIILLGTGPSSAVPQLHHILTSVANRHGDLPEGERRCEVCTAAYADPNHPNRRDNICSIVVIAQKDEQDRDGHLLIDVGKTFRSSVLRWFPKFHISHIDAVMLSHGHADAVGGLDDLRDVQGGFTARPGRDGNPIYAAVNKLPVYLTRETMRYVSKAFSYIVEASLNVKPADRRVAMVSFEVVDDAFAATSPSLDGEFGEEHVPLVGARLELDTPRLVDLSVRLLPVYHGGKYISMGYVIGTGYDSIVYISDVSEFPLQTLEFIDSLVPFRVLILDSLFYDRPHYSHICVHEAIDFIKRWRPEHTYLVGFACRPDREWANGVLLNDILPAIREGRHTSHKYEAKDESKALDDVTFRPYAVRKRLSSMPESKWTPSWHNIKTITIAQDGTFIPLKFRAQ